MKKVKVNGEIKLGDKTTTVGEELMNLLNNSFAPDGKTAGRQVALGTDLKYVLDKKAEYFLFEEADQAIIESIIDTAAQRFSAILIGPIYNAVHSAEAFKPELPAADQPK